MSREVHVRFCESLEVQFLRATHPYIWTQKGWSYLAVVMDLYSRKIIGWSVSDKPDTSLVLSALSQALVTRNYVHGQLMFHSDQGCQYTSKELCRFLRERGIVQSMSRRGQCWDNAPNESFFKTMKLETGLAKAHLPGPSEVESVLFDWIETRSNLIHYCPKCFDFFCPRFGL